MTWTRHRTAARAMLLLLAVCGVALAAAAEPEAIAGTAAEPQATAATTSATAATAAATPDPELLARYCIRCHSDRLRTGGLTLEHADVERIAEDPELWEKIAWKVRIGAMPKVPAPRPERPVLDRFASAVEGALDRAAAAAPDPGPPHLPSAQSPPVRQRGARPPRRGGRRTEPAAAGRDQPTVSTTTAGSPSRRRCSTATWPPPSGSRAPPSAMRPFRRPPRRIASRRRSGRASA